MPESSTEQQANPMPKPGGEHRRIEPFEGKFRAEVKIWMGPGDPMVSTGTMINTFELNGLYLQQDYTGDQVEGPFPSFCGKGFWGFNTSTGKYEGFWIDNASTTMQFETGNVDAAGKIWTMDSEIANPETRLPIKKRSVITLIDHDRHKMEMFFCGPDNKQSKAMEINYERIA